MTDNEVKWLIVGKLLRRNLMAGVKEATMYSYNGVVLPKLPEWDRETYPYAFIRYSGIYRRYELVLSDKPYYLVRLYYDGEFSIEAVRSSSHIGTAGAPEQAVADFWRTSGTGDWMLHQSGVTDLGGSALWSTIPCVWANYPVCVAIDDGDNNTFTITDEVRYQATDPIPVYE